MKDNVVYKPSMRSRVLLVLIGITIIYVYTTNVSHVDNILWPMVFSAKIKDVTTQKPGCRIPIMNPFDESILPYIQAEMFNCSQFRRLVIQNDTHLMVNVEAYGDYNITQANCYYQNFWRVEPKDNESDSQYEYNKTLNHFKENVQVIEEYVRVMCYVNSTYNYTDFYSFVPVLYHGDSSSDKTTNEGKKYNAIVIGLDGVSRLNFHRQLPETLNYLLTDLDAVEFIQYNKVGHNTYPNLMPMLTGQSENEISQSCWKNETSRFDDCDFVWKKYNDSGYVTAYGEDSSWMGLFNYAKLGFKKQPTTHFWCTFNLRAEEEIGNTRWLNADLCLRFKATYTHLLEYALNYIRTYTSISQKYFGFFWINSLTHDYLNLGTVGDTYIRDFFQELYKSKLLKNTILFFVSDHGIRWGDIMDTHQGRMEGNLPFIYIVVPESFRKDHPEATENLQVNSKRLTTPFDVHETLRAIAENDFGGEANTSARGINLFKKSIPLTRTCETANISDNYCMCRDEFNANVSSTAVQKVSSYVVSHINSLLTDYQYCATLQLSSVDDATVSYSIDTENNNTVSHYTVLFQTTPGNAIFEATLRCTNCGSMWSSYELSGSVNRNNIYGHQSDCVNDAKLKLYCFCI